MKTSDFAKFMDVNDASPGDLVSMDWQAGSAMAIVLQPNSSPVLTRYAILAIGGTPSFYVDHLAVKHSCLNFGSDWYLEIDDNLSKWPEIMSDFQAGDIVAYAEGLMLRTGRNPHDIRVNPSLVNLTKFAPQQPEHYDCFRFQSWRIWRSEADRDRVGAKPLIERSGLG